MHSGYPTTGGDPFASIVPETVMPFGKHRGKTLAEVARVDKGYLDWVVKKADLASPELKAACQAAMGVQPSTMFATEGESPRSVPPWETSPSSTISPPTTWEAPDCPRMIPIPQADFNDMKRKSTDDDAQIAKLKADVARLKKELAAKDRPGEIDGIRLIVRRWFGAMSRRFHPDAGGTAEQQTVVNICYRELMNKLEAI